MPAKLVDVNLPWQSGGALGIGKPDVLPVEMFAVWLDSTGVTRWSPITQVVSDETLADEVPWEKIVRWLPYNVPEKKT